MAGSETRQSVEAAFLLLGALFEGDAKKQEVLRDLKAETMRWNEGRLQDVKRRLSAGNEDPAVHILKIDWANILTKSGPAHGLSESETVYVAAPSHRDSARMNDLLLGASEDEISDIVTERIRATTGRVRAVAEQVEETLRDLKREPR